MPTVQAYLVNMGNAFVPFWDLKDGGVDIAIKHGMPVGTEGDLFELLFDPGDITYDIGAYIGTHAIQMALLGGIVYAFEPSPENFERCKAHCQAFRQIKVFPYAFHEKEYECVTKFKDCTTQPPVKNAEQKITYKVFDNFVSGEKLKRPDFIKIDIEGMEAIVLKTMDELFQSDRPVFFVETHFVPESGGPDDFPDNPHWRNVEDGGFDFNKLKEYHYKVIDISNKKDVTEEPDINECVKNSGAFAFIPDEQPERYQKFLNYLSTK